MAPNGVQATCGAEGRIVRILVPNWNTRAWILEFLESLARQSYPKALMDVVVVDNGSTDGSQEAISDWLDSQAGRGWGDLRLVALERNCGVGYAYNVGHQEPGRAPWGVLRGESDVEFDPDCVAALVDALASRPGVGVVGARGVRAAEPSRIDHAARMVNWWTGAIREIDPVGHIDCDCVFGGAFIVRAQCLDALGTMFLPDRFLASELELCTRIKRLGFGVACEPRAEALHKIAQSTSRLDRGKFEYLSARELALLHLVIGGPPRNATCLALQLAQGVARAIRDGNSASLRGTVSALRAYLLEPRRASPFDRVRDAGRAMELAEWLTTPTR
jgi:GT2 family glycosyltransferase